MALTDNIHAHLKIAVAMRAVRGALGITQGELAVLIGISKPTVARVETLEASMRLDDYANMLKKMNELGVKIDTLYTDNVKVEFEPAALDALLRKLADQDKRRSDRRHEGLGLRTQKNKTEAEKTAELVKGRNEKQSRK